MIALYSTVDKPGLIIKGIPSKVKSSVTEVVGELRLSSNILHYKKPKASNEGNNLHGMALTLIAAHPSGDSDGEGGRH